LVLPARPQSFQYAWQKPAFGGSVRLFVHWSVLHEREHGHTPWYRSPASNDEDETAPTPLP